jgi:predicted HTH transcriptional regulator
MLDIQEKGKRAIVADKIVKSLSEHALNARQDKIVHYLLINERITNDEAQKLCASERRTATRDLASLVEKGLIQMKGERKGAHYILVPNKKYGTL